MIINSFYTGEIELKSDSDVVPLLHMSVKYQCDKVSETIVKFLTRNLTVTSAIQCLGLSLDNYKELQSSVKVLLQNYSYAIFTNDRFVKLNEDEMVQLMSLIVKENNVLDCHQAAMKWVSHDESNRKDAHYNVSKAIHQYKSSISAARMFR
ncbi:hypothetical protein AKO1_007564 [Acrasis kona]|uniref:BACK domain-containing protein n=1 Tax=Acrasis kona TaxID=1008807 RepID=A0AAW2YMA8_9EUKA